MARRIKKGRRRKVKIKGSRRKMRNRIKRKTRKGKNRKRRGRFLVFKTEKMS